MPLVPLDYTREELFPPPRHIGQVDIIYQAGFIGGRLWVVVGTGLAGIGQV